jgi:hypothetical protein
LLSTFGNSALFNGDNITIIVSNSTQNSKTDNQNAITTTGLLKDIIPPLGGLFLGIVTAIVGLYTYSNSASLKRKEILKDIIYPLFDEYNSTKIKTAKDILIYNARFRESDRIYDATKLGSILVTDMVKINSMTPTEKEIKMSFDNLFNFISKLEYLYNVKILNEADILNFKDPIKKIHQNGMIMTYIKNKDISISQKLYEMVLNQEMQI